jgi:DNA polymerase III delta prime subunit
MTSVESQLQKIQKQALDLGLRSNNLLNFTGKSKCIHIVEEHSKEVFEQLVNRGKMMTLIASPVVTTPENNFAVSDESLKEISEHLSSLSDNDRLSDSHLQTTIPSTHLEYAFVTIRNEAKTILNERGVDILFLALGFLEWYEDAMCEIPRYAPLILVPVEFCNKKKSAIRYTDIDITENMVLSTKMWQDFGIHMPEFPEPYDVDNYLTNVQNAIITKQGWKVHNNKIALGFFAFSKFALFNDLDITKWPYHLQTHSVLRALLESGFEQDTVLLQNLDLREILKSPDNYCFVMDADSSQTEAILSVMSGANLVIQGPPGTGKSQTISNIISEAVNNQKKVLFVAQKMAALEVVKNRLNACGLEHLLLEIHSHKSTSKQVLTSINAAQNMVASSVDTGSFKQQLTKAREHLDKYTQAVSVPILSSGKSFIDALGNLLEISKEPRSSKNTTLIDKNELLHLTSDQFNHTVQLLKSVEKHLHAIGSICNHALADIRITAFSPLQKSEIVSHLQSAMSIIINLQRCANAIAQFVAFPETTDITQCTVIKTICDTIRTSQHYCGIDFTNTNWIDHASIVERTLRNGKRCITLEHELSSTYIREAFSDDSLIMQMLASKNIDSSNHLMEIREVISRFKNRWWRHFSVPYYKARYQLQTISSKKLTHDNDRHLADLDKLIEFQQCNHALKNDSVFLAELYGPFWKGRSSDFDLLQAIFSWITSLIEATKNGSCPVSIFKVITSQQSLPELPDALQQFIDSFSVWEKWHLQFRTSLQLSSDSMLYNVNNIRFITINNYIGNMIRQFDDIYHVAAINACCSAMNDTGLSSVDKYIREWCSDPSALSINFSFCYWNELVTYAYTYIPEIGSFDRPFHEQCIREFRKLDNSSQTHNRNKLLYDFASALRTRAQVDGIRILNRELTKKRQHLPLRQLFDACGDAIQQIKPVFMMSPMSVATFLPLAKINFDIVIFDEASQVPVADAIGAIVRGSQVVVVGDSQQMPPTDFFSLSYQTDDDYDITDTESILNLFISQNAPQKMLNWHYRSRHDSLIYTSNKFFYDNKLKVFPSSGMVHDAAGLSLVHLPQTIYDKGNTRTNIDEARAVALHVVEHAKTTPHLSLGIVTFSNAQKEAILIQVEIVRSAHPEIDHFFSRHTECSEFFIKNLENVQGDERDVILLSIGYGKNAAGKLSHNFGPLNKKGGERRFNVMSSRAKYAMVVFSNFKGGELTITDDSPIGIKALKAFLTFAESGLPSHVSSAASVNKCFFVEQIRDTLIQAGIIVDCDIGYQGFTIDIAVRHPKKASTYICAILLDSHTYVSSNNARDRDRLHDIVLEQLGWQIHRVWSVDWYRNPDKEVQRIIDRVEHLMLDLR